MVRAPIIVRSSQPCSDWRKIKSSAMIDFTIARYDVAGSETVKDTVSVGQSTSPWQDGAEFTIAKTNPFGLVTATKSGNKFPVVYLTDGNGNEVPLWLSTLVKGVLNPETNEEVISSFSFNREFRSKVVGHSDPQTWWKVFTDLVGEKKLICYREPIWVNEKRFVLIGFKVEAKKNK